MTLNAEVFMKAAEKIDQVATAQRLHDERLTAVSTAAELHSRELAGRLLMLEQRGTVPAYNPTAKMSLGGLVVKEVGENIGLLQKTKSLRLELKAAGDPVTTASGRMIMSGGVGAPTGLPIGAQNAFRLVPVSGISAVEYSRYTGTQGAAGVQAGEGTAKAAVRPDHTIITQAALTVAGYTKISRQALTDSNELRQAIDVTLRRSVSQALDIALMSGNVAPAFTGMLTLATAVTSTVYVALVDAVAEQVAAMQVAGFVPDVVVLNPSDWLAIQVAKSTAGEYLSGNYLGPLPESLRGLRVVLSPTQTAGKALVLDSSAIELQESDAFVVEIAYDSDDFTKNLATILGETRVIPTFRAVGAAKLVTPKAP